ncbi:hypothetical protein C8J57DRAFT_1274989 [Mycena rebaudengoi]|nr:hypothetical protein C8J57DRAFT_1274989 [Mycena rebaudengoi]
MLRLTSVVALVTSFVGATAQQALCASGACYDSPFQATDNGCDRYDGGVDAWEKCGVQGAVTCRTCQNCWVDGCYSSPTQATGTGCTRWTGGVDSWKTCGFTGAIICNIC